MPWRRSEAARCGSRRDAMNTQLDRVDLSRDRNKIRELYEADWKAWFGETHELHQPHR
jgi:hypothetical protein